MRQLLSVFLTVLLFTQGAFAQTARIGDFDSITRVSSYRNYIANPSAQYNEVIGRTLSNATATRSTTTPIGEGGSEWNVTVTSANGTIDFTNSGATTANLGGANCEATADVRGFQATSKIQIYDGTNVLYTDTFGAKTNRTQVGFIGFPCPADPSTLRIRITDTATLSGTNEIANVYLGKSRNIGDAGISSAWATYTPTITNLGPTGTVTTNARWRRIGDSLQFNADFTQTANFSTVTGTITVDPVSALGLTVDTSKLVTSASGFGNVPGEVSAIGYNAGETHVGRIEMSSTSTTAIRFAGEDGSGTWTTSGAVPGTFAVNTLNAIRVSATLPIVGWANASSAVSPSQSLGSRARYTLTSQAISTATTTIVDFSTLAFDTNSEVTTGAAWKFTAKKSGYFRANACIWWGTSANWTIGETASIGLFKNNTQVTYSEWYAEATATLVPGSTCIDDVVFLAVGDYIDFRATQNSGASSSLGAGANYNWAAITSLDGPNSLVYVKSPVLAAGTGVAPASTDVDYNLEVTRTSDVTLSASAGSYSDVTGLSTPVDPGAYDYEGCIHGYIRGAAGTGSDGRLVRLVLTDSTPTDIRGAIGASSSASVNFSMAQICVKGRLLVTSSTTYKLRAASIENNSATTNPTLVSAVCNTSWPCFLRFRRAGDRSN